MTTTSYATTTATATAADAYAAAAAAAAAAVDAAVAAAAIQEILTTAITAAEIAADIAAAADLIGRLYVRWQDESKYEDFAEYKTAMQKNLPDGWVLESFTKRPFRIEFRITDGTRKWMRATAREVTWGGFKPKLSAGTVND